MPGRRCRACLPDLRQDRPFPAGYSIVTDARPPKPGFAFSVGVIGHRPNRLPHGARSGWTPRSGSSWQQSGRLRSPRTASMPAISPSSRRVCGSSVPWRKAATASAPKAACGMDFVLAAPLPFPVGDYEKDFAALESRNEFRALLEAAESVMEFSGDRQEDAKAYERAGMAVLDMSDLLIAVWDGKPSAGRGGTTEMVYEAARRGMPVIRIDPAPEHPPQSIGGRASRTMRVRPISTRPFRPTRWAEPPPPWTGWCGRRNSPRRWKGCAITCISMSGAGISAWPSPH